MKVQPTPFLNRAAIKQGKRLIVAVVGGTVLAVGFALLVLPGPALLIIPTGLAILALEFAWARGWLRKARGLLPNPKPRAKPEMASLATPENYHRARAAAACRNTIPSIPTETTHQP
ncbi:MAG: PGPGW domain-containing protein [Verrucomicrobia bacterium]|nr:PGPGW domain-containing protein [Verrucomicrobiota bacterium]